MAGLAQCWTAAAAAAYVPEWPGLSLWVLTGVLWLVISAAFVGNATRSHRWRSEATDPTFGVFTSLGLLVPTLFFISAVGRQVKVRRNGGARCNGLPSKADDQRGVNLREQTPDICIPHRLVAVYARCVETLKTAPARQPKERCR